MSTSQPAKKRKQTTSNENTKKRKKSSNYQNDDQNFDELQVDAPSDVAAEQGEEDEVVKSSTSTITVEGNTIPYEPILSFKASGFPRDLLVCTQKFDKPTPIQSQCWPILLDKKDVIGIAQTGSGKTLAFGLPGLLHIKQKLVKDDRVPRPHMLVLAPTRELAMQTDEVLQEAAKSTGLKVACIYGGASKATQKNLLVDGIHIIVATPGRLMDFLGEGACDLSAVTYLVLDEADRMLDMGFEPDIRKIIGHIPAKRQTAMFSATWPESIQKLAHQFLISPVRVTIGVTDGRLAGNNNVTQIVEVIESTARDGRLLALLRQYHSSRTNKILIFVLYKKEAAWLEKFLTQKGWNSVAIHSNKNQSQRTAALNSFKSGATPLLVATDVASRGLDIPLVEYVVNYSFPLTIEDYVHRIGRTGRAGKTGISHTFFQPNADKQHAGSLVNVLKETNQSIPEDLLQFDLAVKKKEPKLGKITLAATASSHITFDSDEE